MTDAKFMCECLRHMGLGTCNTAADLIEQQAAEIERVKACNEQGDRLVIELQGRIAELNAARTAYASEFPLNADGEPDVGNIHANIRAMKAKATLLEQLIDIYDDGMNNAPEHRCYVEGAWSEVLGEARAAIDASEPKKEPT